MSKELKNNADIENNSISTLTQKIPMSTYNADFSTNDYSIYCALSHLAYILAID